MASRKYCFKNEIVLICILYHIFVILQQKTATLGWIAVFDVIRYDIFHIFSNIAIFLSKK